MVHSVLNQLEQNSPSAVGVIRLGGKFLADFMDPAAVCWERSNSERYFWPKYFGWSQWPQI